MSKKNSLTRQGVRDLSNIGSRKSVGRKMEIPPASFMCDHKKKRSFVEWGVEFTFCADCGEELGSW